MVFDHEVSQGQIFADCGVHSLVKQVVDVSSPVSTCRAITQRSSPTDKRAQAKPSRWRGTSMRLIARVGCQRLSLKPEKTKVSCRGPSGCSSKWLNRSLISAVKNTPCTAATSRSTRNVSTTCSTSPISRESSQMAQDSNSNWSRTFLP